jgi:ribosomal protein L31
MDVQGRVERFNKRYGKNAEQPAASEAAPSR